LVAAREAFEDHGYAATIEDIASRAGTSRGTFYLYFSKSEALSELVAKALSARPRDASTRLALSGRAEALRPFTMESVRVWLGDYIYRWEKNRLLGRAWIEGDVRDPDVRAITDARIRRTISELSAIVTEVRTNAGLATGPAESRARAAIMDLQLQYFTYHVLMRGLDVDIEAGIDALAQSWYASVLAAPGSNGDLKLWDPSPRSSG
jgi:AcrR family transcriptional regulator